MAKKKEIKPAKPVKKDSLKDLSVAELINIDPKLAQAKEAEINAKLGGHK